jgi:hypothetical protein
MLGLDLFTGTEYTAAGGSLKAEDFMIFYTGGKLANEGRALDAYNYGVMLTSIRAQVGEPPPDLSITPTFATTWPIYLYSPPATLLFTLLARLPYFAGLAVWLLAGLAAMLLALYLLRRALPYLQRQPYWVLAFIALGFWPLNIVFTNGQNSAFTFLAYVAAFYLTMSDYRRRTTEDEQKLVASSRPSSAVHRPAALFKFIAACEWLAGLAASALALQKPQLLLGLLLVWLLVWKWRALAGLVVGVLTACALTLLALPPATFGAWLGNLLSFSTAALDAPIPDTDVTVRTLLRLSMPFAKGMANALYYVYFIVALCALVLAVWRLNRAPIDSSRKHLWLYVLAALFSVATPNYLLIYDLTLLLLPILLLFALYGRPEDAARNRPRLMAMTAFLYVGVMVCHFIGISTGVQPAGVVSLIYIGYALFLFYEDTRASNARFPQAVLGP